MRSPMYSCVCEYACLLFSSTFTTRPSLDLMAIVQTGAGWFPSNVCSSCFCCFFFFCLAVWLVHSHFLLSFAVLCAVVTSLKAKMYSWPEHEIENLKCNLTKPMVMSALLVVLVSCDFGGMSLKNEIKRKRKCHWQWTPIKLSYQESDASSNAFSLNCKVLERCVTVTHSD